MQCGIGKVNAAARTMTMISLFAPDLVISTGVAGGTGSDAGVLDVVVGEQTAYHDVWCGTPNLPGQVQGLPARFDAPAQILALPCLAPSSRVKRGLIATGDQFVDSVERLDAIRKIYPEVMAVDMESAAIAQVCHICGVDFISVRVVSDTPGAEENNAAQYHNFWTDAPRRTFELIEEIIASL